MKSQLLRRGVRAALFMSSATLVLPAWAAENEVSEVVVTGSRIVNRDAQADTPIMTVGSEAITESGYVTVDQYLNTLPQVVPGISSQSNNPSSNGRAFIDLRGLGSGRNLVLIDGRRGMGSNGGGSVDINTIPASLIERVEVITGGAAATYGPDAVSGVVNFIMKKHFDGVAVNGEYRLTEKGDGQEWTSDITFGGQFADGGNALFNISYFNRDSMYQSARDFTAQASTTTGTFPNGSVTFPSTNVPKQATVDALFGANKCNPNGGSTGYGFNPDGTLFCTGVQGDPTREAVNYTGPASDIATAFYPDFFSYNFAPPNILVLPLERWSMFAHFDKEVSPHFKPYVTAMFTNYNALQQLAPTPASGTTGFTVPVTNPFIPAQLKTLLADRTTPGATFAFSKRFNALGGRTGYNNHDVWQYTMGSQGDITDKWSYDIYYSFGRAIQTEIQGGNVRIDKTQTLLNAADGGASLCTGGLNLFGAAAISKSCQDFISLEAKNVTVAEQNIIEGVVNGELFSIPAGRVLTAIGASYRDFSYDFKPDAGLQPGLVAGFNQQLPVSGKLNFKDVFAEIDVPILADMTAVKRLGITGGVRSTDSKTSGRDQTWKLTVDYTATDWARMRAGYQHAVRSPSVTELFAPQVNNFPTFTNQDPCNTTGSIAATYRNGPNGAKVQALCAQQAATAGAASFVQPNGQITAITGGNPNLTPETANSLTVGFVFKSPFEGAMVERMTLSIDYWSIKLSDVINSVDAVTIAQRCYNRDNANPTYSLNNQWCALFQRDQSNGGIINLQQFQRNQSFINTSGVDFNYTWNFGLGNAGDIGIQAIATYTKSYETQTTSVDPAYDYAGSIGQLTASSYPKWKATLIPSYTLGDLTLQATARYIDGMVNAQTVTGGSPVTNTGVSRVWYYDLTAKYNFTDKISVHGGINNVANQPPLFYTPNVQANTDPSLYDLLGRRYFVGFQVKM